MIIYFHFRSIKAKEENGRKKSAKAKPQKQNNYIIDSWVRMMIPFSNILHSRSDGGNRCLVFLVTTHPFFAKLKITRRKTTPLECCQ